MARRRKDKERVTVDEIRLTTGGIVTLSVIPGEHVGSCFINQTEVGQTAYFVGTLLRFYLEAIGLYSADETPDKNTGLTGRELREAYEHDAAGESI